MERTFLNHPDVLRADLFAARAHAGQKRKYTGEPYINHPRRVVLIVASVGHTKEELMAALLHDVVEDVLGRKVGLPFIDAEFGEEVAGMVDGLSDVSVPSDGKRDVRKAIDRAHVAAASASVHKIKTADVIENVEDITRNDPGFARVYVPEKELLLNELVLADPILMGRARELVAGIYKSWGRA